MSRKCDFEQHLSYMNLLMNLLIAASMTHLKEKREGFLKRIDIEIGKNNV